MAATGVAELDTRASDGVVYYRYATGHDFYTGDAGDSGGAHYAGDPDVTGGTCDTGEATVAGVPDVNVGGYVTGGTRGTGEPDVTGGKRDPGVFDDTGSTYLVFQG